MIETKQLQYLVVCADLKSFSRAAEVLYTTQPNVSKVIRSLEEEIFTIAAPGAKYGRNSFVR